MDKETHKARLIAMIPARIGSTRLAMKNLALLDGKPLVYYAIRAAKEADVFDRIVLNSEDPIFLKIAKRYKIEFYQRPQSLGSSAAKSDSVVYDFIRNNPCDIVTWVNPTAPLQTGIEIREVVNHFLKENLDSLITVKDEQVHCLYKGEPINFKTDDIFARTQDLAPVQPFVYSVMMWRSRTFMAMFEKEGYALFCGKFGVYPVSKPSTVIIKREEDLALANYIVSLRKGRSIFKLKYDKVVIKERKLS